LIAVGALIQAPNRAYPHWSAVSFAADTHDVTEKTKPSNLLLWIVAIASLAAIGAGIAGAVLTGRAGAWLTFAFQLTVVITGVLGVLQGIGKIRGAPSMAALCVAGTFFVAGFLGYYGAGGSIAFGSLLRGDLGAFNDGKLPSWVLLLEMGAACVAGAVAGLLALGRSPKESWKQLVLGLALGAPVVIGAAAAYKMHLVSRVMSLNMIVSTVILVVLFVLVVGLLSASGNAIIKAFSAGLPDLDNPGSDEAKPAVAAPKAG